MSSILRNTPVTVATISLTRWRGAQHPTQQAVIQRMQAEGLKPYLTSYGPNARDGVRSHGYGKVLYCVEGSIEISLPDLRQTIILKPGDRLELPRGTRHGVTVGLNGARCMEGAIRDTADNRRVTQEVKAI
jgi:quercetin dioxygenase-like cupin family protein